jgi:polyisoprenoid-binding protein YceI
MPAKTHSGRRIFVPILLTISALLAPILLAPSSSAQESIVQIDPDPTKIEFSLGGNMHTVHGKFSLKSSTIRLDPSTGKIEGRIVVDALSGESGNGSRDARMHREILESFKFPEIVFTPMQITGQVAFEGSSNIEVSGRFRLHGEEHDLTLPVEVKANGKDLQFATHMEIPYAKWGLKNPSNFFFRVSDVVAIDIHGTGRVQTGGNP